jgi:Uma2 family endonuclease
LLESIGQDPTPNPEEPTMSQGLATELAAPETVVTTGEEPLYEVIDGKCVEKPPTSSRESHLASILVTLLGHHAWVADLGRVEGEMLFKFFPDQNRIRRPDVAFVSFERWPKTRRVPASHGWEVVPDLAVEVVSPTDGADELLERIEEYFLAGVRRVWAIFPGRRHVFDYASVTAISVLRVGDRIEGGDLLPGFEVTLADLFEVNLQDDEQSEGGGGGPGDTEG